MNPNSIWQTPQPKFSNQLDLKIEDPSSFRCSIFRYSQSHRVLTVAVHKHRSDLEPAFYLVFESVWYFQGPMSWDGIDFEMADLEERKTLLQKVFQNIENRMDSYSRQYALYVIYKPKITIQILAGNCFTLKSIPS